MKSKGNIEGVLSNYHGYIFSGKLLDAYAGCLARLFSKLEKHAESPQVSKIDNFIRIISSLYSLIWFINSEAVYDKHINLSVITADNWALVRDYYDLLLRYINQSWELLWSNGAYKDSINAKIGGDNSGEEEIEIKGFEIYVTEEYGNTIEELISIASRTVEMFKSLKVALRVKTTIGEEVKPPIFPHQHMYLQPERVQNLERTINAVTNNLELMRND